MKRRWAIVFYHITVPPLKPRIRPQATVCQVLRFTLHASLSRFPGEPNPFTPRDPRESQSVAAYCAVSNVGRGSLGGRSRSLARSTIIRPCFECPAGHQQPHGAGCRRRRSAKASARPASCCLRATERDRRERVSQTVHPGWMGGGA